jgi:hypothetical protein
MEPGISYAKAAPGKAKAMATLDAYVAQCGLKGDLLQIGASLTQLARYTIPEMGPCRSSPVGQTGL